MYDFPLPSEKTRLAVYRFVYKQTKRATILDFFSLIAVML